MTCGWAETLSELSIVQKSSVPSIKVSSEALLPVETAPPATSIFPPVALPDATYATNIKQTADNIRRTELYSKEIADSIYYRRINSDQVRVGHDSSVTKTKS